MMLLLMLFVCTCTWGTCMANKIPGENDDVKFRREIVVVNYEIPEPGAPRDYTKTGLSNNFCYVVGKQCPGQDLQLYTENNQKKCKKVENSPYYSTPRQCVYKCIYVFNNDYDIECRGAYYDGTNCHLRNNNCKYEELVDACPTCVDLYRLNKGDKCKDPRHPFDPKLTKMSKRFCVVHNKRCPKYDYYPQPKNLNKIEVPSGSSYREQCFILCAKLADCVMVDWDENNKLCYPKTKVCTDDELVESSGFQNALRLEDTVTKCPPKRQYDCLGTELTDTCKIEKHVYCPTQGDCTSPFHVIREFSGSCETAEKCQEECDKECSCKAFRFNKSQKTCLLVSTGCSQMDNTNSAWSFHVKLAPDGRCAEDLHSCCRDTADDIAYCPVKGESVGFNIRVHDVTNVQACEAHCTKECACKAFVFNGAQCWLKSTAFTTTNGLNRHQRGPVGAPRGGDWVHTSDCGARRSPSGFDSRRSDRFSSPREFGKSKGCGFCDRMGRTEIPVDERSEDTYFVKSIKGLDCGWVIGGRCSETEFKYCRREGDCPSHEIRSFKATAEECRQACDKECSCKAFSTYGFKGCSLRSIVCSRLETKQCACKSKSNYYVKIRATEACPPLFGELIFGPINEHECCQFDREFEFPEF